MGEAHPEEVKTIGHVCNVTAAAWGRHAASMTYEFFFHISRLHFLQTN
jgi:hypothetical protein